MRISGLFAVVVVAAVPVIACSGTSTGTGTTSGGTSGSGASGGTTAGGGSGTCDGACGHYLQCKNADNTANRAQCNQVCAGDGYSTQQLAQFQQADCATAIAAIEGTSMGTGTGGSGGGTTSGGTTTDCNGCQWDGSTCIWISPSTGLYQSCAAGCCPGH